MRIKIIIFLLLTSFTVLVLFSLMIFRQYHPLNLCYKSENNSVPILIYHGVDLDSNDEYNISFQKFKIQMDYLVKNNYTVISLLDYVSFLKSNSIPPKNSVILCFHDNHYGWYKYVFPLLKKYNFKASFFVVTGSVPECSNENIIGWNELKEIGNWKNKDKINLFHIDSHSLTHSSLKKNINESEIEYKTRVFKEFDSSKMLITKNIDIQPAFFALPYGDGWDSQFEKKIIEEIAKTTGYEGIQTGKYYVESNTVFILGGMTIHNTLSSNLEFELALRIFKHNTCISDFFMWNFIIFERLLFKIIN